MLADEPSAIDISSDVVTISLTAGKPMLLLPPPPPLSVGLYSRHFSIGSDAACQVFDFGGEREREGKDDIEKSSEVCVHPRGCPGMPPPVCRGISRRQPFSFFPADIHSALWTRSGDGFAAYSGGRGAEEGYHAM